VVEKKVRRQSVAPSNPFSVGSFLTALTTASVSLAGPLEVVGWDRPISGVPGGPITKRTNQTGLVVWSRSEEITTKNCNSRIPASRLV
jgi:hypothetical protein